MLNYNETMEKIKAITEELKTLEPLTDAWKHRGKLREYHAVGNVEAIREAEADYLKHTEKEQTLKRFLTVYKSNAEKLYVLENIQTVFDIFNRYKGKKCGEKTKEKIIAEAKTAGISMYFSDNTIIFHYGLYGYDRKKVYARYIDGKEQTITDAETRSTNCLQVCFTCRKWILLLTMWANIRIRNKRNF